MRLLFIGESWEGSSARSMKESLRRILVAIDDEIDEINEDLYFPRASAPWLRAVNRILLPAYRREFARAVLKKCIASRPDALVVYKGHGTDAELIQAVKAAGIFTVNIFPDASPHIHGERLKRQIGEYDLVISTKPFHPALWLSTYGYRNHCEFIPHGYDASIHLLETPPSDSQYDLGLIATWRPEHHDFMQQVAGLLQNEQIRVAIAGNGWLEMASAFPKEWNFSGAVLGATYAKWAQLSKILIAPVSREVVINGQRQPGDEDSTRTYELAAANCFFIHRRTSYIHTVYEEETEVPFYDDAEELVKLVKHFLVNDACRIKMAAAAHARAVPAYSIDSRAKQIANIIRMKVNL